MTSDTVNDKSEPSSSGEEAKASGGPIGWLTSLRQRLGFQGPPTLRDTLEYALREETAGASFSAEERDMLLRLLRFGTSRVEDVMVPRADIIALDESEPLSELLKTFQEAGVSRIPLFHDTLDDPRGMIHIKDLFRWLMSEAGAAPGEGTPPPVQAGTEAGLDLSNCDLSRPISVAKIRRNVLFVPPSMPAMNLLIRMQTTRQHMALVVDEYGGTDGLVTIEDLVEQIVGAIEDEHDETEAAHVADDPKLGLVAAGRTPVVELEERFGLKLLKPDEETSIDTLGGLVVALVGRVPGRGELVRHPSGFEFEVLDADPRRVKKLKIHVPKAPESAPSSAAGGAAAS